MTGSVKPYEGREDENTTAEMVAVWFYLWYINEIVKVHSVEKRI